MRRPLNTRSARGTIRKDVDYEHKNQHALGWVTFECSRYPGDEDEAEAVACEVTTELWDADGNATHRVVIRDVAGLPEWAIPEISDSDIQAALED